MVKRIFSEKAIRNIQEAQRKYRKGRTYEQIHGKIKSERIKKAIGIATTGVKNGVWKGDDAGYGGMHDYLRKHYGKPVCCINPICSGKSICFERSKIDHNIPYTRNIEEYQDLCSTCHKLYDRGKIMINGRYG